jgi:hypothetical protein
MYSLLFASSRFSELACVFDRYLRGCFMSVFAFVRALHEPLHRHLSLHHGLTSALCEELAARLTEGSSRFQHVILMLLQVCLNLILGKSNTFDICHSFLFCSFY